MTSKLTREQATDSELQMLIDSHEKGTAMFLRVDAYYLMAKELQERRKAETDSKPFGFVTKRCAEHMHDDDSDEFNWMWSISAVVIGCDPKLQHIVPVYLHPVSPTEEKGV